MQSPICRKRRTSSIMEGQFTRSKSQIYLHCNRSGRARVDPNRFKRPDHQLRQLDQPVKKPKRVIVEKAEEVQSRGGSTRLECLEHQLQQLDSPVKKPKMVLSQNPEEVSSGLCKMTRTPIKDLRARRVFSPEVPSIVLENDDNLKKGESMVFEAEKNGVGIEMNGERIDETGNENGVDDNLKKSESMVFEAEKNGVGFELNGEKVDDFQGKKCDEIENVNEGVGNMGIESNGNNGLIGRNSIELSSGNVTIPKSNSAVSSSLRRKVFIAPSSYSYRRLLPYLMETGREHSDVSEIETRDTPSKCNNPTLSYLRPHLRSATSNGFASVDKHVGANSDVSKTLGSVVEGQKVEVNVSCNPQDLNDVPDVLSQTQVEPRVFANGEALDSEALEECVQTTPPDADIFLKANRRELVACVEHNAQQMGKKFLGHPLDSRNSCIVKKSSLTPGTNGSASRNKLALNPCSKLKKVFKAASSVSYRRLLPYLMDVAKNDPGSASSENGLPKFLRDLECNRPLMSESKEVVRNKEYSPKIDEIKEQETKLLEPNCASINDARDEQVSSSAAESFTKMPSSVFPDDVANSDTLLNVEMTKRTDTRNTEKSETEYLNNVNTGEKFSEVPASNNVSPETSAGEYNVAIPNLLPISLEDLLSEYGIDDLKAEPISPEGDRMTLEVECNEENRIDLTGTVGIHAHASESLKKELFVKISEPEPINNESSCKDLLVDCNGDSGELNAVALIKASSSNEPSDLTGYGSDGPTKALCESIQEISQAEPIVCQSDCMSVDDNLNRNGCLVPAICHQKSTQTESSYDTITHTDVLNKGILKRNPRGCRGLCNCLSCASFRLHAERSFEFSRNQMQDTKEVSLGLMKELADMRIFLEKRLSSENNLAPIPLTQLEVEAACTKALEAEQRAKERLSQMNNELNYHCRVPSLYRPRVTFATHIEEKAVAKIESSSSRPENDDIKAGIKRTLKKHH